MIQQTINAPGVPAGPIGSYSTCKKVGDTVFISGTVAWDEAMKPLGGNSAYAQSRIIFGYIKALMEAAGMKPEEITAATATIEASIGYAKTMELFRQVGVKTGEARFLTNDNPANHGLMTKDAAAARLGELKSDTAFVSRYLAGDAAARREMDGLHAVIAA